MSYGIKLHIWEDLVEPVLIHDLAWEASCVTRGPRFGADPILLEFLCHPARLDFREPAEDEADPLGLLGVDDELAVNGVVPEWRDAAHPMPCFLLAASTSLMRI